MAKKEQDSKKMKASEAQDKVGKYTLNINKYAYSKDTFERIIQLTAFFHMIKLDLGENTYCELIIPKIGNLYIPYTFNLYETMALTKDYIPETLYVELDEENYIEINIESIVIHGTNDFYNKVKKVFIEAESYHTDISVWTFDVSTYADWLFKKYLQDQYTICIELGNHMIQNGSFCVYPLEDMEVYVVNKEDYDTIPLDSMEYVCLRSNIEMDKMVLIDIVRKKVYATGFNELETLTLADAFKPTA